MSELKKCPFCGGEAKHWLGLDNEKGVYCTNCKAGIEVYGTLEELYNAWNTRTDGWISVEDRLPEIEQEVLLITASKNQYLGRFIDERNVIAEDCCFHKGIFTHWQPFPEPPKGD